MIHANISGVSKVVANGLAPIWCQGICNHYYDVARLANIISAQRNVLTHWGRVTHICVGNQTITGSDNGLSPDRRQAIIWTNARMLLIGP